MPRTSKYTTNINQYSGYSRPKRIEMSSSVSASANDAINKTATDATDKESEQIVSALWDRTFVSYQNEMVVKLPYYFQSHYTQPIGFSTPNQFKINSIYDFDLTGVGHQPLGRDTWTNIYDYYKVLETRCEIVYRATQYATGAIGAIAGNPVDSNAGSGYMAPLYVGTQLDITANPPTTLTTWHEAARVTANTQQIFSPIKVLERFGSRAGNVQRFSTTWTPDMFDTAILDDATVNTWTPVGSDPGALNYLTAIAYNSNSGAANSVYYSVEVTATFLVAFKNVKRALLMTTN